MTLAALLLATWLSGVPQDALVKGKALIAHGRYDQAARFYEELASQYPGWVEAQLGLGYSLEHLGRLREAQAAYENALRLDARDVRVLNNLAFLLVDTQQDVPRAIRLLTSAVKLRNGFAPAWDNLGFAYFKTKDYGTARTAFLQALARDPNYAPAHYHMGMIHLRQEDYTRARKRFERAVSLDQANAKGWLALGVTQQKLNDREAAYKSFARAKALVDHKTPLGREVSRLMAGLGPMYGGELGDLGGTKGTLLDQYAGFLPRGPDAAAGTGTLSPGGADATGGGLYGAATAQNSDSNVGASAGSNPEALSGALLGSGTSATGAQSARDALRPPRTREPHLSFPTRRGTVEWGNDPEAWLRQAPAVHGTVMHHAARPPSVGAQESYAGSAAAPFAAPPPSSEMPGAPDGRGSAGPAAPRESDIGAQAALTEGMVKRDLVDTHLTLARLFLERGLPAEAQSEAQTVVNVAPFAREASDAREIMSKTENAAASTPDERIYILLRTAQELAAQSNVDGAVLVYEKVLLLAPNHPVALKDLAYLNATQGKLDEALAQSQRALDVEPDFAEALVIKGYAQARRRRFKDAYETFQRLAAVSREGTPQRQYADRMAAKMRRFVELE